MKRKILYSPGYGAGWTSWMHSVEIRKFAISYGPIIEAIERDGSVSRGHPAVVQFTKECEERFGDVPYLGGVDDLQVMEVSGPVRINDYDGSESVEEQGSYEGYL